MFPMMTRNSMYPTKPVGTCGRLEGEGGDMGETRRITPAEVVAAYAATGMKPARTGEDWFTADGCGCGAAAMIAVREPGFRNPYWPFPMAAACLGVSRAYLRGFVHGFEGTPVGRLVDHLSNGETIQEIRSGHQDGWDAATAIFKDA
jgi:hypothetical protein